MKRTLALLLTVLMLFTLLVGCAGNQNVTDSTPTESGDHTNDLTETPVEGTDEDKGEIPGDSAGEQSAVELPQPGPVELPITDELTTYSMWVPNFMDSAMPYNDPNEYPVWQELERRTNIHIDFTLAATSNAAEQFSLMLTSQSYTDLFAGAESNLVGGLDYSIEEEIIVDLSEQVPQYAPNYYALMTADEYTRKILYTDEGNLGKLQVVQESPEPPFAGWVARQDMLDAIGFEGTMETIEDWDTVLAGLKEAELGKLYLGSGSGQQEFLMTTYGVTNTFLQKDGKVFYGPTDEGYYDYLAKIVEWNEAGYIDPDFVSHTAWYSDFSMMVSGEIAIMPTIYTIYDVIAMMGAADPNFALVAVDIPKLNEGDTLKVDNFGGPAKAYAGGSSVCVSTQCEDVPTILKWFDYMCTEEGKMLTNYGIEGESYTMVDGAPTYTDLILANAEGYTKGQMQGLYTVNSYITHCYDYTRGWGGVSEESMACMDIWCDEYDFENNYDLPPVQLTTEESEDMGSAEQDIATYVEEYSALVVTGQKDLASTWDEYVANIEAMGLQRCIDVYQAACDRFNAR